MNDEEVIQVQRSTRYRSSNLQEQKVERKQRVHDIQLEQKERKTRKVHEDQTHRYTILFSELEVGEYKCFNCNELIIIEDVQQDRHKIKFYPFKQNAQTGIFQVKFIPHCSEICAWESMSRCHDAPKLKLLFIRMYGRAYCSKPRELLYLPPSQRMTIERYKDNGDEETVKIYAIVDDMSTRPIIAPMNILTTTMVKETLKPTDVISSQVDKYYHVDTEATVDIGVVNMESNGNNMEITDQKVVEHEDIIYLPPAGNTSEMTLPLEQVPKRRKLQSNNFDMNDD